MRGTEELTFANAVLACGAVEAALKGDAVGDLHLQELKLRLVNGEVGHLNVEAVEVNSSHTLFNILSKFALANLIKPVVVRECAGLMEFTEELVNLKGGIVEHELVPEAACLDGASLLLEVCNDLLKIPGEGQHVCVLLLIKCHIDSQFLVSLVKIHCGLLLLLQLDLRGE